MVGLGLLKKNAFYCSVDPSIIFYSDPVLGEELIQAVDSYYRHGLVGPIDRITAPDVLRPERFLQHDRQLVASSEHPENLLLVSSGPMIKFDPDSSYVVTGALGGLGQSLIRWMDDRGTRYLHFFLDATSVMSLECRSRSNHSRGMTYTSKTSARKSRSCV